MDYGVSKVTRTPANFVGSHPTITKGVTLASNGSTEQTILAGTVLGKVTASGKYVPWNPGASDGSQNAVCVLVADTVVKAAVDEPAAVYVHGNFLRAGMNWGAAEAAQIDAAVAALEAKGVYVK